MQKIDEQLLQRLENLSMLQIDESHREKVLDDLNQFLAFVDVLDELDLDNIPPTFNVIDAQAPLRADEPHNDPTIAQKILSHAPKAIDQFFVVPKIIE
ncbi:Asp-tRNA(Asn)/Glu-tRNA(Gln) amidotransferase subunit GatC [Nitratiruptor sp. YY09-18]|uniref:Asp-tRNA(Asn)/Glu-tRNA(Gln) amidotransferase subunit GatC n=1 Tax=Nitratiruptor sp. YY09-18 TaxID=2724901 RepID=UPI0019153030|nr:Asp-tRNA(Asn)/Glu-tRNA(Gln) amidotransferase subunit GatC [Nitratiruptor sp. YY09-18]BCD67825.1 aspartyl-tRNA(Asn)/glutamyl-tRNA(Gln) amidotransferase subunit C [Nitratiruptor sp. YY09-18]